MWLGLIEVGDIGLEHPRELLLVEDEQVIETLPPHAPQEAPAIRIGAWRLDRCAQRFDPGSAGDTDKVQAKLAVMVTDQKSWGLSKRRRFSELLSDPGIGGMARHSDADHLARLQFDDEEGKERTEEEISDW